MIIFWMFVGLFLLIMINVPIAIALGIVAVVTMVIMQGMSSLPNVALVMFDGATKFPLLAIPLFIFAGAIMNTGGISKRLIAFASALVGFVKGGLAMASTATAGAAAMTAAFLRLRALAAADAKSETDVDQWYQGIAFDLDRVADYCLGIQHALNFADCLVEHALDAVHLRSPASR